MTDTTQMTETQTDRQAILQWLDRHDGFDRTDGWVTPRDVYYDIGKPRGLSYQQTHSDLKALERDGHIERRREDATESSTPMHKRAGWRWQYRTKPIQF